MKLLIILIFIGYIKCNIIHYINEKDTCNDIINNYNIINFTFDKIYQNIDCNNLQNHNKIEITNNKSMIISANSFKNIHCFFNIKNNHNSKYYELIYNYLIMVKNNIKYKHYLENNESCYDIMVKYNIFYDTFYEINPGINCNKLNNRDEINIITYETSIVPNKLGYMINIYTKEKYNLTFENLKNI